MKGGGGEDREESLGMELSPKNGIRPRGGERFLRKEQETTFGRQETRSQGGKKKNLSGKGDAGGNLKLTGTIPIAPQ